MRAMISTSQPSGSSVSCANRAPLIDSITARTLTGRTRRNQAAQAVGVGRHCELADHLPLRVDQADVDALATEIRPGRFVRTTAPGRSIRLTSASSRRRELLDVDSAGAIVPGTDE